MTTATITRHVCPGCARSRWPATWRDWASIRVLGEQADPAAAAAWAPDGLVIATTVQTSRLAGRTSTCRPRC